GIHRSHLVACQTKISHSIIYKDARVHYKILKTHPKTNPNTRNNVNQVFALARKTNHPNPTGLAHV
ncbi:hypothetical protein, partial [Tessaracoccus caeni]|uniref:hypothetical protein n=1 Tax=Tessaracoccus caeni TaxID=3031239 RepID=UPI0023DBDCD8